MNINIRFADSINGDNISKSGFNKKYIGYSYKNTNNPKDYLWVKKMYTEKEIIHKEELKNKKYNLLKLIFLITIIITGIISLIILQFKLLNMIIPINVDPYDIGFLNILLEIVLGFVEFIIVFIFTIVIIDDLFKGGK